MAAQTNERSGAESAAWTLVSYSTVTVFARLRG
jgi:hypothetical protein